ncbi:hypothetical protein DSM104299_00929 [Baekduia alba]|uniref:hypothetical protein n=1 Tax=Baekduia alba TaxID=2997333 RepID=UPI0023420A7B|nr:hypothetical protein [Baekduia alba]WCB92239.1 hypothetical protein DSM104299_00929 [Baekduia alba]
MTPAPASRTVAPVGQRRRGSYYGPKDCYRSSRNWVERYLDTVRASRNVTFVNRACSGGVLNDLTNKRSMDDKDVPVWVPGTVDEDEDDAGARAALVSRGDCTSRYRDDEAYTISPYAAVPQLGGTSVYFTCKRSMLPQIDAVGLPAAGDGAPALTATVAAARAAGWTVDTVPGLGATGRKRLPTGTPPCRSRC